jgi:putative ABC transport system permease protein
LFRSYLISALRHLVSQKGYSLINVLGLAIGMAAVLVIGVYARSQFLVDQWHEKKDRIYKVMMAVHQPGTGRDISGRTDGPLAKTLEEEYPEVEMGIHTENFFPWTQSGEKGFQQRVTAVPPEYFDVFDFRGVNCDPKQALQEPNAMLITQRVAEKFFGDEDPIGKTMQLDGVDVKQSFTVTGILEDVRYSSIWLECVISRFTRRNRQMAKVIEGWNPGASHRQFMTTVLLKEGVDPAVLEPKIQSVIDRYLGEDSGKVHSYILHPFDTSHLYGGEIWGYPNRIDTVVTFLMVSGFILAIAIINYINLMTARAARRAPEIGLRKVVGGQRGQLILQFLGESVVTSLFALGVGVLVAHLSFPHISELAGWGDLRMSYDADTVGAMVGLVIAVGLLSGVYPAIFLTRVDPAVAVKGEDVFTGTRSLGRRALVVVQFACSIAIVVGTVSVRSQLSYITGLDMGFDWKNVIDVPILWVSRNISKDAETNLAFRYNVVRHAFKDHPNVLAATSTRFPQGVHISRGLYETPGKEPINMGVQDSDEHFYDFYGIEILAGRVYGNQTRTLPSGERILLGSRHEYILNEKAVEAFGWKTDDPNPYANAIGQQIRRSVTDTVGVVVGVCEDFHFQSMRGPVGPAGFTLRAGALKYMQLRLGDGDFDETMDHVKKVWNTFLPTRPFDFNTLEESLTEWNYWEERRLSDILDLAAWLAIAVSCLGLLGLVSYLAETRTKEIAIRKTLGATTGRIVRLLTVDFALLILIANLVSWPIAWWAIDDWLNDYAYRMHMDISIFLATGFLAFAAAGLMIAYHTFRAATRAPVDAMRR